MRPDEEAQITAADRYWRDVAANRVTMALNVTIGEAQSGLVGLTLTPNPVIHAALHSPDALTRTRAMISSMRDAGKVVESKYPQVKLHR